MKCKVMVEKEVDIKKVSVTFSTDGIWEYANDFPMVVNQECPTLISFDIDIDRGYIIDWPKEKAYELFAKVCDSGTYRLYDKDDNQIACIEENYVPNNLIPGEYGDYIDIRINKNGQIYNWYSSPDLSDFFRGEKDE